MKILEISLENFCGMYHGRKEHLFEFDFTSIRTPIIQFLGKNGCGKTTLLNSLTPFSHITDTPSSLILDDMSGKKSISIESNNHMYDIVHLYIRDKSISMKSYIKKDGDELNPSGNVTSFRDAIKSELSYMPKYTMLTHLSSMMNNFAMMNSQTRKSTINSMLFESGEYDAINKDISSQLSTYRKIMKQTHIDIEKLNITSDTESYEDDIRKHIQLSKDRLNELNMSMYKLNDNLDSSAYRYELSNLSNELESITTTYSSVDDLKSHIAKLELSKSDTEKKISDINAKIDEINYRLVGMYKTRSNIQQGIINMSEKISIIKSKTHEIESLKSTLSERMNKDCEISNANLDKMIEYLDEIERIITPILDSDKKLKSKILDVIKSKNSSKILDDMRYSTIIMSSKIVNNHMNKVFPVLYVGKCRRCDDISLYEWYKEFQSLVNTNAKVYQDYEHEQIVSIVSLVRSYTRILDLMKKLAILSKHISPKMDHHFTTMFTKFSNDLSYEYQKTHFIKYANDMMSNRIEMESISKRIQTLSNELSTYDTNSYDLMQKEVSAISGSVDYLNLKLDKLDKTKIKHERELWNKKTELDKLNSSMSIYVSKEEMIRRIEELKNIIYTIDENNRQLELVSSSIRHLTQDISQDESKLLDLSNRMSMYKNLASKLDDYVLTSKELSYIAEATSIKMGLPMMTLKGYLDNINNIANSFLDISHRGSIHIPPFNIDESEFSIPFIKDGHWIEDIRYASQGEKVFISNAINFAFLSTSPCKYRILCFDEIDAALDYDRKSDFFNTLLTQIKMLGCDQIFIITHNPLFDDESISTQIAL